MPFQNFLTQIEDLQDIDAKHGKQLQPMFGFNFWKKQITFSLETSWLTFFLRGQTGAQSGIAGTQPQLPHNPNQEYAPIS
jgi:hypothetical protein